MRAGDLSPAELRRLGLRMGMSDTEHEDFQEQQAAERLARAMEVKKKETNDRLCLDTQLAGNNIVPALPHVPAKPFPQRPVAIMEYPGEGLGPYYFSAPTIGAFTCTSAMGSIVATPRDPVYVVFYDISSDDMYRWRVALVHRGMSKMMTMRELMEQYANPLESDRFFYRLLLLSYNPEAKTCTWTPFDRCCPLVPGTVYLPHPRQRKTIAFTDSDGAVMPEETVCNYLVEYMLEHLWKGMVLIPDDHQVQVLRGLTYPAGVERHKTRLSLCRRLKGAAAQRLPADATITAHKPSLSMTPEQKVLYDRQRTAQEIAVQPPTLQLSTPFMNEQAVARVMSNPDEASVGGYLAALAFLIPQAVKHRKRLPVPSLIAVLDTSLFRNTLLYLCSFERMEHNVWVAADVLRQAAARYDKAAANYPWMLRFNGDMHKRANNYAVVAKEVEVQELKQNMILTAALCPEGQAAASFSQYRAYCDAQPAMAKPDCEMLFEWAARSLWSELKSLRCEVLQTAGLTQEDEDNMDMSRLGLPSAAVAPGRRIEGWQRSIMHKMQSLVGERVRSGTILGEQFEAANDDGGENLALGTALLNMARRDRLPTNHSLNQFLASRVLGRRPEWTSQAAQINFVPLTQEEQKRWLVNPFHCRTERFCRPTSPTVK